jgi:hypothetical protein
VGGAAPSRQQRNKIMMENEDLIKEGIEVERVFIELFRELGLKAAQCNLIRAFLVFSNGEIEFEASYNDLAKILFKTNGYDKNAYNNTRNALIALEKWQKENELTLIECVEKGRKDNDLSKGKAEYKKSKYRFVLLADLAKTYAENPSNLEEIVESTIEKLKRHFVPIKEKKKYSPNHLIKKAKNTIYTKLGRIFELAVEVGDSPFIRCKEILDECWNLINYNEPQKLDR